MNDTRLSLAEVFQLREKAFAASAEHAAVIDALAAALGDLDAAMQTAIAVRCIDDAQNLIDAARRLAAILSGRQV